MATQDPIDKLFKEKAEEFLPQPSLRSWRRIERRMNRRNGYNRPQPQLGWVRAVAALFLIGMAGIALWQLDFSKRSDVLAQQASEVQEVLPTVTQSPAVSFVNYSPINEGEEETDLVAKDVPNPQFRPAKAHRIADTNI